MKCYLFDIDGTLADLTHRLHHILKKPKDWDAFFDACQEDAPIEHVCELARNLREIHGHGSVVFVSGRSDRVINETLHWLMRHIGFLAPLYMREAGDHRDDYIVKGELLDRILADGYTPVMAFDDRNQVVSMWRARGIPCAQVVEGNF